MQERVCVREIDTELLKPLSQLGINLPNEAETTLDSDYLQRKRLEERKRVEKLDVLMLYYGVRDAFPTVYNLLATVDTFGCSTAVCESLFFTLARIGIPKRISRTNERMRRLTFLAFESKRAQLIKADDVMKAFNDTNIRKVQLY